MSDLPTLSIDVDRTLPIQGCDLVFASTDSRGTPGPLSTWTLRQLGMSADSLSGAAKDLKKGYAIIKVGLRPTLALVVTVGGKDSAQLLRENLAKLLSADHPGVAGATTVWLPLMGTGSGAIGAIDSLDIELAAIDDHLKRNSVGWDSIRISLGSKASQKAVERLRERTRQFFRKSGAAVDVNGPPPTSDVSSVAPDPSPEAPERGFNDNLRTQIDAPPVEPLLGFPQIAASIVAVVEEAIGVENPRHPSNAGKDDSRHREWLSAADARLTVGIFAPWGAGKSTLINALRDLFLQSNYPVFAVNPWKWDGSGDLHDHVRKTVIEQARRQGKVPMLVAWLKMRTFWRNYAARLWWCAVVVTLLVFFYQPLVGLLGWFGGGSAKDEFGTAVLKAAWQDWLPPALIFVLPVIAKYPGDWLVKAIEAKLFKAVPGKLGADGLSLVYRDIATLIYRNRRPPRPFVFFFDDLDRCAPERVAAVLESVHSLTMAGCIVFLACDDEYVTAALNAHYKKVARVYRDGKVFGRSYLEKIVQIHFKLPLLKNADIYELGLASRPAGSESSDVQGPDGGPPQPDGADDAPSPLETAQDVSSPKIETDTQLQEIIGDLLGEAVEPLGLNVRQAKAISNTLKLYLRISNCRTEAEACRVASFVFADRFDPVWLDAHYRGVGTTESPFAAIPNLASRLSEMIGPDQAVMLQMYRLLGRRPSPQGAATASTQPAPVAALAAQ